MISVLQLSQLFQTRMSIQQDLEFCDLQSKISDKVAFLLPNKYFIKRLREYKANSKKQLMIK